MNEQFSIEETDRILRSRKVKIAGCIIFIYMDQIQSIKCMRKHSLF